MEITKTFIIILSNILYYFTISIKFFSQIYILSLFISFLEYLYYYPYIISYFLNYIIFYIIYMESNKVVLGYWGIRGLAERIRLILQYVGVAYTQKNYSNPNDWFGQDKPLLGTNCPLINLPYLQDGERVIAESDAIIAYVVLKNNPQLLGRNIQQRVDVVQLRGSFADFHRQYVTLVYGQNFEENKTKFLQTARTFLTKYSNFLGTKQYFVGGITVIDFLLAQFFDVLRALSPGLVQSFGNLNELTDRILGLPQIKAYRQSDRFIKSPYNGPSAAWGGKA